MFRLVAIYNLLEDVSVNIKTTLTSKQHYLELQVEKHRSDKLGSGADRLLQTGLFYGKIITSSSQFVSLLNEVVLMFFIVDVENVCRENINTYLWISAVALLVPQIFPYFLVEWMMLQLKKTPSPYIMRGQKDKGGNK